MSLQADFYFDYGNPTSYLAYVQLPGIAKRSGVTINYKPILLARLGAERLRESLRAVGGRHSGPRQTADDPSQGGPPSPCGRPVGIVERVPRAAMIRA
jgi:hypothetical protein